MKLRNLINWGAVLFLHRHIRQCSASPSKKQQRKVLKIDDDDLRFSYPTPACRVGGPGRGFWSKVIPLGPGPIGPPPIEPPIDMVPFFGMM